MNVANRKCISRLSFKSLRAASTRNIIAILAIALTTILFTSLFTIAMSINTSFEQSNFKQAGGYAHGTFKYLTKEQYEDLKNDKAIKEYGLRRFVGIPVEAPFDKNRVEVGYSDTAQAKLMYCTPTVGALPREGTSEAVTETKVLELLGVEPKVGAPFTMTFNVDGKPVTRTFILSGWWESDGAITIKHVITSHSMAQEIFDWVGIGGGVANDEITASWGLDVMLESSRNIEAELNEILQRHETTSDKVVSIGVNWGYTGAQLSSNADPGTIVAIVALLLLIMLTGYLIIFNVFQISVSNDIRFYGLLKTIGTTAKQIKRIIRLQAMRLSMIGIPLGLAAGFFVGAALAPMIVESFNGEVAGAVSVNPIIFIVSSLFALSTVFISCSKPGRVAAKVSPIEAVRYTEGTGMKRTLRRGIYGVSLIKMAWANTWRSTKKTLVTIASLALAVVLLNLTVTFTNGFDMDKYLKDMVADYIIGDANYFNVMSMQWGKSDALTEEDISRIEAQPGIVSSGRVYGRVSDIEELISEEYFSRFYGQWNDADTVDRLVKNTAKNDQGLLSHYAQAYGMEDYVLSKVNVVEGDISKLSGESSRYIAAVYDTGDYGEIEPSSNWAKLRDKVTLNYVEEYQYFYLDTGEPVAPDAIDGNRGYSRTPIKYEAVEYEVAAIITIPKTLGYRYYGTDEFVLGAETFVSDTKTNSVMYYALDLDEKSEDSFKRFAADFTGKQNTELSYESKETYAEEFYDFRNMFLIMGGMLSFIVGLVGILNFLNAVLTGIMSRRRELAMLQSIGMTGKQLKKMLAWEGCICAGMSISVSFVLSLIFGIVLEDVLNSMFWFFTYKFTIAPVAIVAPMFILLGICVPLIVYKSIAKRSIVERLRAAE